MNDNLSNEFIICYIPNIYSLSLSAYLLRPVLLYNQYSAHRSISLLQFEGLGTSQVSAPTPLSFKFQHLFSLNSRFLPFTHHTDSHSQENTCMHTLKLPAATLKTSSNDHHQPLILYCSRGKTKNC